MFCKKCGKEIPETSKFCPYCGTEKAEIPGQPLAAQAPSAAPVGVPRKNPRKIPLLIIAAIVVVLIGGGIVFAATGIISSLFGPKTAAAALYEGTENLAYDVSSATLKVKMGATVTFKWDLGKDLADSIFWAEYGGQGFIYKNDTIYTYYANGSGDSSDLRVSVQESGIIAQANDYLHDELDLDIDCNKFVKNGKFDRDYIETTNKTINDATLENTGLDSYGSSYGISADDIDTVKMTEILDDFMSKEVDKSEVYEKFMSDVDKNKSGDEITYSATFNIRDFFEVLAEYAKERGKQSDYADAADLIVEACDLSKMTGESDIDVEVSVSLQNNILSGLELEVEMPSYGAISGECEFVDINATDLEKDEELQSLILAASDESSRL
jgi:hypothetical protein